MRIVSVSDVLARGHGSGIRHVPYGEVGHGEARGFVAGSDKAGLCMVDAPHAVLVGRTGVGKTVSCLMPTLLANGIPRPGDPLSQPNMVVVDCKNTVRANVAPLLKAAGYKLSVVDLGVDGESPDSWNPLSKAHRAMSSGGVPEAERALSNFRDPFVSQIASEKDRFWEASAWEVFCGTSLALLSVRAGSKEPPTLREVFEAIHDVSLLRGLAAALEGKGKEVPAGLRGAIGLSEVPRTWQCVVSTVEGFLSFYATDQARSCAERDGLDFSRSLFAKRPLALFLQCPDTSDLSPQFASLLMGCLYRDYVSEFERRGCERGGGSRGLLIAVDEFARYKFSEMPSIMACGRSRGVRVLLAIQSFSQFMEHKKWTEDEARVMCEQAGASILMSNTSPEIARQASFVSGGAVDGGNLCTLPAGAAYVTVAGSRPSKTSFLPFAEIAGLIGAARERGTAKGDQASASR